MNDLVELFVAAIEEQIARAIFAQARATTLRCIHEKRHPGTVCGPCNVDYAAGFRAGLNAGVSLRGDS